MKAMVFTTYGSPDVLHLEEVATPVPKANEVLIQVVATALNAADVHLLRADPFLVRLETGLFQPKNRILGADIAGRVVALGPGVSQFKLGDAVFGDNSGSGWGGFAEYACVRADVLVAKPESLSFEQAAALPMAAVTALQALRHTAKVRPGDKVLINGASGGVGSYALQIAKALGAEVTAVCSTAKLELARSLGADRVIDYSREDFTTQDQRYDVVLAANGFHKISAYKRILSDQGRYVMTGGSGAQMFQAIFFGKLMSKAGGKQLNFQMAKPNQADLAFVKDLVLAGKLHAVIDKTYPLAELPAAFRYLEAGHVRGKLVITI